MRGRRLLLYAIASCLSFNITFILSMLFYTPPALNNPRHSAQRQPLHHAAPGPARAAAAADDDDKRRAIAGANWDGENVKRRVEAAGVVNEGGPAPRRPANRLITDYDPNVARRVRSLARRRATSRDPELIALAADVIDAPPINDAPYKMFKLLETPQSKEVDRLLGRMEGGFFVECGGLDGERLSNTAFLERQRHWQGLLIEMDPFFYTQLLGKNRRVWSLNACLSPYKYFTKLPYAGDTRGRGRLIVNEDAAAAAAASNNRVQAAVPCFPLDTILDALNRSRVDYFSLDIEGFELPVLKTIDWQRLDIRVLSVEFKRGKDKQAYREYMESNGYRTETELHNGAFFVDDFIFVSNRLDNDNSQQQQRH